MCFGGGGGGSDAREIQERNEELERQRQQRIREGAAIIDDKFSRFDDGFFGDFKQSFLDFQEPQIDKQFNQARGQATAALVDRGILGSTEGIRALTNIQDRDALVRTNLANQAADRANELRGNLAREKSNLFALNETAADPERITNVAQGAAQSFAAPQAFDPLENVFGNVLNNVAAFQAARSNAVAPRGAQSISTAPIVRGSSSGSGRVVG